MPPPNFTIVGELPADFFFTAMLASGSTGSNSQRERRQAYPRFRERVKAAFYPSRSFWIADPSAESILCTAEGLRTGI
jgi:hypothetical protein